MAGVKSVPRRTRRERADQTRRRIVECAYALFRDNGYPATTMETIAASARVAVQTVYYVFRTKAQLLQEVIETAAAGQNDAAPVMQRSWMQAAFAASDGHRALALAVEHGVDIYARVAPLGGAIQSAAAAEPDVEAYWRRVADGRRAGMAQLIGRLVALGQLRRGLSADRAADVLYVLDSHEVFIGLTRDAGWTVTEFKAWLYGALCEQLLARPRSPLGATADLTFHDRPSSRPGEGPKRGRSPR